MKIWVLVAMCGMAGVSLGCKGQKADEVPVESEVGKIPSEEDTIGTEPAPEEPIDEQPLMHSPADAPVGGDEPF